MDRFSGWGTGRAVSPARRLRVGILWSACSSVPPGRNPFFTPFQGLKSLAHLTRPFGTKGATRRPLLAQQPVTVTVID